MHDLINKLTDMFNKPRFMYPTLSLWLVVSLVFSQISKRLFILFVLGLAMLFLYVFRPCSKIHNNVLDKINIVEKIVIILVMIFTIAVSVLPMSKLSLWNGEDPGHRNQYELMAENILAGRLSFDYGDEDQLAQLNNPYDPVERQETGVLYHWDHAYYDGEYYMYFGVVPVFLLFLPYRVITGTPLTTFHATQVFAVAIILGIFVLFRLLAKLFFKKMPASIQIALSIALSIMSIWHSIAEPALYCTAITAAIALQIWSIYFYIRAVWQESVENKQIMYAGIGAILGALVFGCRPSIALANLLVIPMLIVFIKQRKFTMKLLGKLLLAASPYIVVAIALMLYNYVRFDNPFEFGQAYQLTVADQSQYGVVFNTTTILKIINETWHNLFDFSSIVEYFPYLTHSGVFINFPILFLTLFTLRGDVRQKLRQNKLIGFMIGLVFTILLINIFDILWTPYLLERYRMDLYFLVGIACFIGVGFLYESVSIQQQKRLNSLLVILSVFTILTSFLLCLRQVEVYYPEIVDNIKYVFLSWEM